MVGFLLILILSELTGIPANHPGADRKAIPNIVPAPGDLEMRMIAHVPRASDGRGVRSAQTHRSLFLAGDDDGLFGSRAAEDALDSPPPRSASLIEFRQPFLSSLIHPMRC